MEQPVNLSALAVGLGLEVTDYEPEQFSGLITGLHDYACVVLIFASGKVVSTGAQEIDSAEAAFAAFRESIETFSRTSDSLNCAVSLSLLCRTVERPDNEAING